VLAAEDVANQPVMSLHAITSICMEDTMHLYIHVRSHRLLASLDSDSTRNFINARVMRRLQLVTSSSANMRATVANGDCVARNVAMSFDREDFSFSCYIIDLGGFDFDHVLGVDFLRTLGPILWD